MSWWWLVLVYWLIGFAYTLVHFAKRYGLVTVADLFIAALAGVIWPGAIIDRAPRIVLWRRKPRSTGKDSQP